MNDSAEEVFGKVMRVSDELVKQYFEYGTLIPLEEVESIMREHSENPMELKKVLARQIVRELCSEDQVGSAEDHFVATVQNKEAGDDAKTIEVAASLLGTDIVDLIAEHELAESKSQARRLVEQSAVHLGDETVHLLSKFDIDEEMTLRVGKRRYIKLSRKQ